MNRAAAALLILAGALAAPAAQAQGYPNKQIRLIVPYPPGGSADILARTLGQQVQATIGQPIVIDNKGGAGTAIGAREAAGAAPDGYTIMLGTVSSHAMNPIITAGVGYDPIKDFTPITPVASIAFAFVVHPSVPAKTLREFIELAKKEPGKLSFASAGVGTSNHLAGELFKSMANIDMLHVPYKGSAPALADLLGGRVSSMFDLLLTTIKHVNAGTVRPLAVTSATRSPLLSGVPTFIESGLPQYEVSAWFGIFAPAKAPAEAVARLNAEFRKAVASPDVAKRLESLGADPMGSSPPEFARFVQSEHDKWSRVIKAAGISAEK